MVGSSTGLGHPRGTRWLMRRETCSATLSRLRGIAQTEGPPQRVPRKPQVSPREWRNPDTEWAIEKMAEQVEIRLTRAKRPVRIGAMTSRKVRTGLIGSTGWRMCLVQLAERSQKTKRPEIPYSASSGPQVGRSLRRSWWDGRQVLFSPVQLSALGWLRFLSRWSTTG